MSDARFDDAVDRAVREMLDVEPPAGLRARVMSRIEEPHVASGFSRKVWWFAAPIAAAAVILLAVVIARRDAAGPALVPNAPPSIAQANPQAVPPQVRPAPSVETPVTSTTPSTMRASRDAQRTAPVVAEPGLAVATMADAQNTSAEGIAPLREVAPIAVAAINPRSIAPSPIQIAPLGAIAEMQITALTPPDGRH